MKNYSIKQLDKMRYNSIIWFLVGFVLMYCPYDTYIGISDYGMTLKIIAVVPTLIGLLLLCISGYKYNKIRRIIKTNPSLNEALCDEFWKDSIIKATRISFVITQIIALVLSYILGSFVADISGRLVCRIIIFVAVSSFFASLLIFNRNQDGNVRAEE